MFLPEDELGQPRPGPCRLPPGRNVLRLLTEANAKRYFGVVAALVLQVVLSVTAYGALAADRRLPGIR